METFISLMLFLLPLGQILPTDTSTAVEMNTLVGAYGVHFGMDQQKVVQTIKDQYKLKPDRKVSREDYIILEFGKIPRKLIHQLRVFIHSKNGVFAIEEEIKLRWNLQQTDLDNLENHQKRLDRILSQLRSQFGNEVFLEDVDLRSRFKKDDFVTATWSFAENHWIHVIYEPQDWELFPEINKIIIIYRDSNRDPRDH